MMSKKQNVVFVFMCHGFGAVHTQESHEDEENMDSHTHGNINNNRQTRTQRTGTNIG